MSKKNFSILIFVITLVLIAGNILIKPKKINNDHPNIQDEKVEYKIEENYEEEKKESHEEKTYKIDDYIVIIKIPKINLERKLYAKNSKDNNVDQNIQILKESSMPNEDNSNLILASHSGTSNVAYFNNLSKLENDDPVYIFYNGYKYTYLVSKIIEVIKDGNIVINRNTTDKYLTLITCKIGTNRQYVVICKLLSEEKIN